MKFRVVIFFLLSFLLSVNAEDNGGEKRIRAVGIKLPAANKLLKNLSRSSSDSLKSRLEEFYRDNGYAFAKVEVKREKDTIVVKVAEGPYCRIAEIKISPDSLRFPYMKKLPVSFNGAELNAAIENWLDELEKEGKPLVSITVDTFFVKLNKDTAEIGLSFTVKNSATVKIDKIFISGLKYTELRVAMRELQDFRGEPFTPETKNDLREALKKIGIFTAIEEPYLIKNDSGMTVVIPVEEGQAAFFDGVVGYMPESEPGKGDGYFTGLINIDFRNLFGTARKLAIHWQKINQLSDEFSLRYKEPWIFGIPLNGGVYLHRRVQDTLFLKQGYQIELEYPFGNRWRLYAKFSENFTYPDSLASVQRGITDNRHTQYITGFLYDSRDFTVNPRSGLFMDVNFSFGNKKVYGPDFLLEKDTTIYANSNTQQLTFHGGVYYELFENQVLALQVNSGYIDVSKGKPDEGDMFWFGGAKLLRGYRENQFFSDAFVVATAEYRFVLDRFSRIFAFVDQGVFNNDGKRERKTGFGIGVRQKTALGILALDYGIAAGDPFSSGKIHFGIVNEF